MAANRSLRSFCLDSHARVLFLGTLNKSMFVSLRLAYLVVPVELVEPLANVRTQLESQAE